MEFFQAGAHWGCRQENAEACARRVVVFLQRLGRCDPEYAQWYEYGYSRRHSLQHPVEPTVEAFRRYFSRRKFRLGNDGFLFDAWTGQEQRGRGGLLNFTCGAGVPLYPNGCQLYLPRAEETVKRVLTVPVLTEVVRAMVVAWAPDGCAVISEEDVAAKKAVTDYKPCMGWLTYFSHQRGRVPPLPESVRVEPMEDKGSLIILTPELFSWENPEHAALANEVRERLEQAGLLPPRVG
jgi:hypothetical protein